jgi:hypothetical protein
MDMNETQNSDTQKQLIEAEHSVFRTEWYEKNSTTSGKVTLKTEEEVQVPEASIETIRRYQRIPFIVLPNEKIKEWYEEGIMPGGRLSTTGESYKALFPEGKVYILTQFGDVLHVPRSYLKGIPKNA